MENNEVALLWCSSKFDFLKDLWQILGERTGFRPEAFQVSRALERTLLEMSEAKLPAEIFNTLLNISIRFASMTREYMNLEALIDGIIRVLNILWEWFRSKYCARIALYLLSICPQTIVQTIVIALYYIVEAYGSRIWRNYIEPRLRKYIEFIKKKLEYSQLAIRDS